MIANRLNTCMLSTPLTLQRLKLSIRSLCIGDPIRRIPRQCPCVRPIRTERSTDSLAMLRHVGIKLCARTGGSNAYESIK